MHEYLCGVQQEEGGFTMNKTFLITDFGAVAGKDTLQTEKIQKAIDACFSEGGGEVIIPEGITTIGKNAFARNKRCKFLVNYRLYCQRY
mgnify:CR=1 FL=1